MNTYEEFLAKYSEPPKKDFLKLSVEDRTAVIYNQVVKEIARLRDLGKLSPEQNLDPMGIVAQILVETGNGTSDLVKQANNFGGIRADKGWKGPKSPSGKYRSYATPEEGLRAQVEYYVENPRYGKAGVLSAKNANEHLIATAKAGYAEDPNYLTTTKKTLKSIPDRLAKANKEILKDFEIAEENTNFIPETFELKQTGQNDPLLMEHPIEPNINYDIKSTVPNDINLINPPLEVPPPADSPMYNNGGTMNFKSKAAYKNYLGYIYANNLNKPGGAPVTIKGKHHEVDRGDQYGGYLMADGGGITPVGYPFNNPTFKAFGFANGGSFNNKGFMSLPKEVQAKIKANSFAEGGNMDPLTEFNTGGTHEQNPLGGIPQGMAPDGQPNLVEQGETKLNSENYIFSDRLKLDKQTVEEFNLPKTYVGKTFAEASKKADRPDSRRENDSIEAKAKEKELNTLMEAQEAFKAKEVAKKMEEINSLDPTALQGMGQPQIPQSVEPMGMPEGMPVDPSQIPPEMLAQMAGAQQGAPIMAMGGHVYMCGGHRYDFGSFMKNTGEFLGNYGKALADASLSTFGATDVISDDMYKGTGAKFAKTAAGITGKINQAGAQIAGNVLLPGVGGKVVSGMQQGIGAATDKPEVPFAPAGLPAEKTPEQIAEEQRQQQLANLNTQYGNNPMGMNQQVMAGGGHMYYGNPFSSSFLNNFGLNTDYATAVANYSPYKYNPENPFTGFNIPKENRYDALRRLVNNTDVVEPEIGPGLYTGEDGLSSLNPVPTWNNVGEGGSRIKEDNTIGTLPTRSLENNEIPTIEPNIIGTKESTYDTDLDAINNQQNFTGSALTGLGALGSMAYNAYMGFGKKPKTYTQSDFYTAPQLKELQKLAFTPLSLQRVNYTPAVQAAERNAAGAMKGLREAGDAGSYLNNLATVQNVYGDAAKNIEMTQANANTDIANKERSYNTQAKQETAKYNTGLNQYYNQMLLSLAEQDARAKQLATEANWRTQAARQASQQQVFSDIYGLGKTQDANTLASMYANIQAPPGEGINYQSWLQSLFNLGKG